ncbi:hypothetical protein BpHYR1_039301 [Brachionus plicatilis]|uniref:Uncharacterized protein n=1 Tax=Brachionus plicatilis TaxID=10195 RepID=A0A3M7QEX8_BRAPC|nr:hypothetical protein BpHYR1_039301 [Brachionus plicatilis]
MVHLKPRVHVRPCTKYPTHGIKACVAKQGDTFNFQKLRFFCLAFSEKEHFSNGNLVVFYDSNASRLVN